MHRVAVIILVALGLLTAGAALFADRLLAPGADDLAELRRTWDGAHVVVPTADGAIEGRMAEVAPALAALPGGARLPLVIYLHGCAGFHGGNRADVRLLAQQGFAVVAPDSFARADKPLSCDWRTRRAGLHWGAIFFRLAEAHHALARARALPWVDAGRIALIGQSEGGFATARFGGQGLVARVIMGWTCALPVPFMNGVAGPADVPVLAVVSRDDHWFRNPAVAGDCGPALAGYAGSRSLVLDSAEHHVMGHPRGRAEILEFLAERLGH